MILKILSSETQRIKYKPLNESFKADTYIISLDDSNSVKAALELAKY